MASSDGSMPSSFDNDKQYADAGIQKLMRKIKEEPLIPIGMGLTTLALINAYRAMKRGDKQATQRMFRARVLAQGFTVVAMVAGGTYYGADRQKRKELDKINAEKDAAERRAQWIHELEVRDAEDRALRERLQRRRERREAAKSGDSSPNMTPNEPSLGEKKEAGSGMLGGWFGGSKKETPPEKPKDESE